MAVKSLSSLSLSFSLAVCLSSVCLSHCHSLLLNFFLTFSLDLTAGSGCDIGAGAGRERRISEADNTAGNRDAGQARAVGERIFSDVGDTVRDRDAGQRGAGIKREVPDAGDAVGNRDAGQAA